MGELTRVKLALVAAIVSSATLASAGRIVGTGGVSASDRYRLIGAVQSVDQLPISGSRFIVTAYPLDLTAAAADAIFANSFE